MNGIVIDASQVSTSLQKEAKRHRGAIEKAKRGAAMKFKAHMIRVVNESGITDTGAAKNGFRTSNDRVWNEAPHWIFIEVGTRPHKVSREGVMAIAAWVRRKLRIQDDAVSIAYAIAKKIEKEGTKPHYMMRDAMPFAKQFFAEELERILRGQS